MRDYGYKVLGRISDNVKTLDAGVITFETIRRFPAGVIRCTCGGGILVAKDAITYGPQWGGCSHLAALFAGRITEDLAESKRSYAAGEISRVRPLVELTDEGRKFFGWRWAVIAMETNSR